MRRQYITRAMEASAGIENVPDERICDYSYSSEGAFQYLISKEKYNGKIRMSRLRLCS